MRTRLSRAWTGTAKHLPNPELVLRPLQNREAQRSSSLEGTVTDPQQQALFQLDPKFPESVQDPANAHREVFNYGRALRLRLETKNPLPLSLRKIRDLHRVLMEGVRGSDRNPGDFRKSQNQIGQPPRYVPPPANRLTEALDAFEKYLHASKPYDPLVDAFLVHYQFEAIHPFLDGNGRVGRLLLAIMIAEWCGLASQWLYMSAYFDKNRDAYMDLLLQISTSGAWSEWIEFCLHGVVEQAKDTQLRCERLLALHRDFHDRLRVIRGSVRLSSIVDDWFKVPVVMVSRVARQHHVTYPTARADLKRLEGAGLIERIQNYEQIAYYCSPIFDITYADEV